MLFRSQILTMVAAFALLLALFAIAVAGTHAGGLSNDPLPANGQSTPLNDLTRQREALLVPGAMLTGFASAPLDDLFLYAYDGADWSQIPFQWDEVERINNTYTTFEDGLLDDDDELSFLARDAGDQAPPDAWIDDNPSTAYSRYELAVDDPLQPGETAWVYVYRSPTLLPAFGPDYLQVTTDTVSTPFFSATVNLSETLGLASLSLNGTGVDIIDGSHLSIKGTLFFFPVQYCEEDLAAYISTTLPITGIIPPEDRPVRYVTGDAASGAGVYPANLRLVDGSFDLDALSAAIPVPGLNLQELRLTLDLQAPATTGYAPAQYLNSAISPTAVAVDGAPDAVPETIATWGQYNGSFGSLVQLSAVEATGTSIFQYYLDDSTAPAGDCHGDDGAYGESGVRIAPFSGVVTVTQDLYFAEPLSEPAGDLYQAYAANPLQVTPTVQSTCYFADVEPNADNGNPGLCDGDVDVADIERVAGCWNQPAGSIGCPTRLDLNRDSTIDVNDVAGAADQWQWPNP